jgi:hypothetical protein
VRSNEEKGEIGEKMDPVDVRERETPNDPADWRKFYEDLDLHVIGTLSKGRNARLSLAVVSASGDYLYAFVREDALGHLEDTTRIDDA